MTYKTQSLGKQRHFLTELDKTTKSKRNLKSLKALLDINHPEASEIITGGILFEAEKIAAEYEKYMQDPKGGYLYSGSDLYKELKTKGLNDTPENPLDVENKIRFLLLYYRYRISQIDSKPKEIALLNAEFKPVVDYVLKQIPNLKSILSERPSLDEISKRLRDQPKIYEEICKDRRKSSNIEHIKYMKLVEVLANPVIDELIASLEECKTENDCKQFKYSIYYGCLLFIMKQIELEYSGLTTGITRLVTGGKIANPADSAIYRFCQSTLNLEHSDDIPDIAKVNFLVDFAKFIEIAKVWKSDSEKSPTILKMLMTCKLKDGFLGPTYFTDAPYFLDTTLKSLENLLTQESFVWSCTKCLSNYAVQTVLAMTCLQMGASIYGAGLGKNVLPTILGRFGREFMGGAMGEKFLRIFAKQMEPGFLTNVYATGIWYGAKQIKDSILPPRDPIYRAVVVSKQFNSELKEEIARDKRKPSNVIKEILELPCTVISDDVKNRVRSLFIDPLEMPSIIREAELMEGLKFDYDNYETEHNIYAYKKI